MDRLSRHLGSRSDEVEISESSREMLAASSLGILTTIRHRNRRLSGNSVGYVWDGESVRISTLASRVKHANLLADRTVALCVVERDDHTRYVEMRGYATLEPDPDRSFLRRQFLRQSGGHEPPADLDPPDARRVTIRIHPERVSSPLLYGGRFSKPPLA